MIDRGGTDPANYTWRTTATRVLGFTDDGVLFLDTPRPTSLREAMLLGYLEGWNYADDLHRAYIAVLENRLGRALPESC